MKAYKVVVYHFEDGTLRSSTVTGHAEVVYIPKKWVRAPRWLARRGYFLFVFRTLRAAKLWKGARCRIWRCEVKGTTKKLPPLLDPVQLSAGYCQEFPIRTHLPDTLMAKAVKLEKEVKV